MLAYAFQPWLEMKPNYSSLTEQAGKQIFPEDTFLGKNEIHSWISRLHSVSSVAIIKNVAYIRDQWQTKRFVIPHPLQLYFYDIYIVASLNLFLLLRSSVT